MCTMKERGWNGGFIGVGRAKEEETGEFVWTRRQCEEKGAMCDRGWIEGGIKNTEWSGYTMCEVHGEVSVLRVRRFEDSRVPGVENHEYLITG